MFALISAVKANPIVRRIDQMAPSRLEHAFFAMGCFLTSEPRFGLTKGVWKTAVGYGGGRHPTPSYGDAGDHAEVVMVEYDPLVVSYGQLLELFLHWCTRSKPSVSPNFPYALRRNACRVFVKSASERRLAQAAIARCECSEESASAVRISAYGTFYRAEEWCQKYFLRASTWLMQEARASYPDEDSFVRSTLAARLNGILGMPPFSASVPEEIELYDLSDATACILKRLLV